MTIPPAIFCSATCFSMKRSTSAIFRSESAAFSGATSGSSFAAALHARRLRDRRARGRNECRGGQAVGGRNLQGGIRFSFAHNCKEMCSQEKPNLSHVDFLHEVLPLKPAGQVKASGPALFCLSSRESGFECGRCDTHPLTRSCSN